MEPDEIKYGEGQEKVSESESRRLLRFTCPACGRHKLDTMDDCSMFPQEVMEVYDDGLLMLSEPRVTEDAPAWYQCHDCGTPLGDRGSGELPWKSTSSLVRWLIENCEQPPGRMIKARQWYEGENSYQEVTTQLAVEGFRSNYIGNGSGWQMERWERRDGEYRLVAIHGNGLYFTDSMIDGEWLSLCTMVFPERVPNWADTEHLVELLVSDADGFVIASVDMPYRPVTEEECETLVGLWLSCHPAQNRQGTKLELIEHGMDTLIHSHTVVELNETEHQD